VLNLNNHIYYISSMKEMINWVNSHLYYAKNCFKTTDLL